MVSIRGRTFLYSEIWSNTKKLQRSTFLARQLFLWKSLSRLAANVVTATSVQLGTKVNWLHFEVRRSLTNCQTFSKIILFRNYIFPSQRDKVHFSGEGIPLDRRSAVEDHLLPFDAYNECVIFTFKGNY